MQFTDRQFQIIVEALQRMKRDMDDLQTEVFVYTEPQEVSSDEVESIVDQIHNDDDAPEYGPPTA